MPSIEQARSEVDRQVKRAIAGVERIRRNAAADEVEASVWTALLQIGCALMRLWFAHRAAAWRGRYVVDGVAYEVSGRESIEVGTRFGKIAIERPVGRRVGAPRAARDLPMDREVGLPGAFTWSVVKLVARLAAQMAFGSARELIRELWGWAPSSRSVLRMVDAAGAAARPFLEGAAVPDDDGEVLVVTVDGKGAPAISSKEYARRARPHAPRDANRRHARRERRQSQPKARRGPGKKSKNAKVAAVGVLYTLKRGADGRLEGPVNKRVYATFESFRKLFMWLRAEAERRGYGTGIFKKVLFIADGANVIWSLQREFFPDAAVALDWYHAVEKLWAAGKAICRGTRRKRSELEAWVAEQKRRLRHGRHRAVLDELRAALEATAPTGPGNKYRREVLGAVLEHFTKHARRMRYAKLRRDDLEISSGVVEGAVRHLVGVRLDGPGMRWGRDRAEAVLHLRCVLINGLWSDFEQHLATRPMRLAARPVPARTHDAVRVAA